MIVRPRPNWEELRGVLAGDAEPGPDGKPKLRYGRRAVGEELRGCQHVPAPKLLTFRAPAFALLACV